MDSLLTVIFPSLAWAMRQKKNCSECSAGKTAVQSPVEHFFVVLNALGITALIVMVNMRGRFIPDSSCTWYFTRTSFIQELRGTWEIVPAFSRERITLFHTIFNPCHFTERNKGWPALHPFVVVITSFRHVGEQGRRKRSQNPRWLTQDFLKLH